VKLPDLTNTAAMIARGQRSALGSARNEALIELRDACTILQSCDWHEMAAATKRCDAAANRLRTLAAMWGELAA
jgi:hypothetical protein